MSIGNTYLKSLKISIGRRRDARQSIILGLIICLTVMFGWLYSNTIEAGTVTTERDSAVQQAGTVTSFLKLDPFMINLADSDGKRFVRVQMTLRLSTGADQSSTTIDPRSISEIRESIMQTLMTQQSEELKSAEGSQNLRKQIINVTRLLLPGRHIDNVVFTEFIVA